MNYAAGYGHGRYDRGRPGHGWRGHGWRGGYLGFGWGYGYPYDDFAYDYPYDGDYAYDTPDYDYSYGPGVYAQTAVGNYCSTPVKMCQLYEPANVGAACSCREGPGRVYGQVTP